MNYWPLIGILVIVVGFLIRLNPVLVVISAGIVTGIAAKMPLLEIFEVLGQRFLDTRNLPLILLLPLGVIGLLERHGLKNQSQKLISKMKSATTGKLLIAYLFIRETSAAMGLTSLGGHAQMVRPLIAPMAESAMENRFEDVPQESRDKIKAMSAATDNVGLFFGEDIFVAFGAIIFMQSFLKASGGFDVAPIHIALWGIPTAIFAFIIHAYRIHKMDGSMVRELTVINQKAREAYKG
ncbi:DUF969 domain-containing protein [Thorsellia kenyensis]|uniref:DUF969 domain-containing protein n=1 Tax=Thorsellia kenyensis TaxID=1549888 RepID=A0ABV6CET7_9GAMM